MSQIKKKAQETQIEQSSTKKNIIPLKDNVQIERNHIQQIDDIIQNIENIFEKNMPVQNSLIFELCELRALKKDFENPNTAIRERDETIKKLKDELSKATKSVEHHQKHREDACNMALDLEFPIHDLEGYLELIERCSSPNSERLIVDSMIGTSRKIIKIYNTKYLEKNCLMF